MLSREATNTNFLVFGLTRPGLEPSIYHTRGEHANHNTTETVWKYMSQVINMYSILETKFIFKTFRFTFSKHLELQICTLAPSINILIQVQQNFMPQGKRKKIVCLKVCQDSRIYFICPTIEISRISGYIRCN
jgi:hypothetical protein